MSPTIWATLNRRAQGAGQDSASRPAGRPQSADPRRLLSRGNSKYHYYGIRLKPDSPLNRLQEDTQYMAMRQQPVHQKPRWVTRTGAGLRRGMGPGFH